MAMVGLRASLYNHFGEEEVYDESDEADNMIVNEHEEYLAYISKYRHEWEEYRGLNPAEPFDQPEQSGGGSFESIVASESWTERGSRDDDTGIEGDSWDVDEDSEGPQLTESDSEHEYGSIESCPTDDISFPSLQGSQRTSPEQRGRESRVVPSMLGPPPDEPDEAWDQEPDFFLGDKNTQLIVPPVATNESEEPNVEVHLSPPASENTGDWDPNPNEDITSKSMQRDDPPVEDGDRNDKSSLQPFVESTRKEDPPVDECDRNDRIASRLIVDTGRREDPPVDEVDFYNSLHYVQSPVSEHSAYGEPDWYTSSPREPKGAAPENASELEIPLPEKYATHQPATEEGIFEGVAKYFGAPEFFKNFEDSFKQASPKMLKKYEI